MAGSSSSTLSPLAPPFTAARGGSRTAAPYDPYAAARSHIDRPIGDRGFVSDLCYSAVGHDCQDGFVGSRPGDCRKEGDDGRGRSPWEEGYGHGPRGWQDTDHNNVSEENVFDNFDNFRGKKISCTSPMSYGTSRVSPSAPVEGCDPYLSGHMVFPEHSQTFASGAIAGDYTVRFDSVKYNPMSLHNAVPYSANIFSSNGKNLGRTASESLQQITFNEGSLRNLQFKKNEGYPTAEIADPTAFNESISSRMDSFLMNDSVGPVERFSKTMAECSENLGASESCAHEKVSSSTVDEHLAIDSPCWKGISSYESISAANESSSCKTFDSFFKRASGNIMKDCECTSSLPLLRDRSSNEEATAISDLELLNGTSKLSSDAFSFHNLDGYMLSSASQTNTLEEKLGLRVTPHPSTSRESTLPIDVRLLVKTLHNLSSVLVESCRSSANALNIHEKEILKSVVENLGICIQRTNELDQARPDVASLSRCSPPEQIFSPSKFEATAGRTTDDNEGSQSMWFDVEEAVHHLKHKLTALKSDLAQNSCQGNLRKSPSPLAAQRTTVKPIDHPLTGAVPLDVDPAVMDRFRLIKDRMQWRNLLDEEPRGGTLDMCPGRS